MMELRKVVSILLVFVMQFVYSGVFYSFGEYYAILVKDYSSTWVLIGFIGTSVSGFSNWVGPLSGKLVLDYGYEVIIPVSGALLALSFLLTSYTVDAWQLFFTYSFMFGCSCGILSHLTMIFLLDTLDETEVGTGVAFSHIGAGLGYMTLSFLAAYFTVVHQILTLDELFRIYALFGVLVIISSFISFLILPRGMEKRHVDRDDDEEEEGGREEATVGRSGNQIEDSAGDSIAERGLFDAESSGMETAQGGKKPHRAGDQDTSRSTGEDAKQSSDKAGWALMLSKDPRSMMLFISNILVFTMAVIPFKFGVLFAANSTGDVNMYYYVPLGMGLATIVSRFVFSGMTDYIDAFTVNKFVQLGCVLSTGLLVVIPQESSGWILFGLTFYGLFNTHFPLVMLRTVALLGPKNHHTNFGVQCVGVGIGYFCGGCIAGGVYEIDSSTFRYVFLTCVAFDVVSILFDEFAFPEYSLLLGQCVDDGRCDLGEDQPLVDGDKKKKSKLNAKAVFCALF